MDTMDSTIIAMATRARNVKLRFDIALLLKGWVQTIVFSQRKGGGWSIASFYVQLWGRD